MLNTLKWLWLSLMPNISSKKISRLLNEYGNIDKIYECSDYDDVDININDKKKLMNKSLDEAKAVYRSVCACGAYILTYDNPYYPNTLKSISDIPYVLYLKGKPTDLSGIFGIGVVGTRNNTGYGEACSAEISYELAKNGAVIISGMALGIDCIAMHAAVEAGGITVGVLGCGIDMIYPSSNKWLFDEVFKSGGLIISEYPPGAIPTRYTFPRRNRIIAGLSKGILVVEGSRNSGSLITASYANKYNRDVFAIPRNIGEVDAYGKPLDGTNYLIQCGARLVTGANDILEYYNKPFDKSTDKAIPKDIKLPERSEGKRVRKKLEKKSADEVFKSINKIADDELTAMMEKAENDTELAIIQLLSEKELYPDELLQIMNKTSVEMSCTLLMMETKGFVKKQADGRYELNK